MGIDGVVADHPGDRAGIEQQCRQIEPAERRRPAHQRAPGEGEAEHDLRPVGDPLHERIDRDHGERGEPDKDREAVELQQHREPDQGLQHEKDGSRRDRHLARRDRPRARALDAGVEIAVDDVVPGAAGAAHGEGADEEQDDVPEIDLACRHEPRRARGTTSTASAAARSRSAGRGGPAADRAASMRGRGRRPNFRSNRRRAPRRGSSRQRAAFEGVEGAGPALGRRSNPAPSAWCRAHRSGSDRPAAALAPPHRKSCLPISEALPCEAFTCLITSAGTPQVVLCSSRPLIILLSAARKALKSLHNSSAPAFFLPAACSAWPCLLRLVPKAQELLAGRGRPLLRRPEWRSRHPGGHPGRHARRGRRTAPPPARAARRRARARMEEPGGASWRNSP